MTHFCYQHPTVAVAGFVAQGIKVMKAPSPLLLGTYESKLNHYQQVGQIHSFTWHDKEVQKGAMPGFTSYVEVNLKDGRKIQCSSHSVYSRKCVSREAAATKAIHMIDEMLALSPPRDQLICSGSESLVYKQKLNNMMQGRFHTQLPDYNTRWLGEQQFQCTVRHSMFGKIVGSVCNSKKEAENVAACRACSHLDK